MAIGAGVAMNSTAFAMPSAIASMRCTPTVSGVMIAIRGDGGGLYTSVIAEVVDADAGAADEMLDASPMARTAINAVTAPLMDRVTRHTRESCRKNRLAHSQIAEPTTAQAGWALLRCSASSPRADVSLARSVQAPADQNVGVVGYRRGDDLDLSADLGPQLLGHVVAQRLHVGAVGVLRGQRIKSANTSLRAALRSRVTRLSHCRRTPSSCCPPGPWGLHRRC